MTLAICVASAVVLADRASPFDDRVCEHLFASIAGVVSWQATSSLSTQVIQTPACRGESYRLNLAVQPSVEGAEVFAEPRVKSLAEPFNVDRPTVLVVIHEISKLV